MKSILLCATLTITSITMVACGGGGGGGGSSSSISSGSGNDVIAVSNPPVVSAFSYSPNKGYRMPSTTTQSVTASIKIDDIDGDVKSLVIQENNMALFIPSSITIPTNSGSSTSFTMNFNLVADLTKTAGNYSFDAYTIDSKNNISNKITSIFKVGRYNYSSAGSYTGNGTIKTITFAVVDDLWKLNDGTYNFLPSGVVAPDNSVQQWNFIGVGWEYKDTTTGSSYYIEFKPSNKLYAEGILYL